MKLIDRCITCKYLERHDIFTNFDRAWYFDCKKLVDHNGHTGIINKPEKFGCIFWSEKTEKYE